MSCPVEILKAGTGLVVLASIWEAEEKRKDVLSNENVQASRLIA